MKSGNKPLVGIIMGSDSDFPVIESALQTLDEFNVGYEVIVSSAHRTPARTEEYVSSASKRGIKVLIAAAGGAAHLPGVVAAYTNLPVIGLPIKTKTFEGIDSLLSIIEMPKGVPVATVGVNNAGNAVLLALRILACSDSVLNRKMTQFRKNQAKAVIAKDAALQKKLKNK
jgi:phosphoribosylaminoimidazole carboxylase PurE protein